MKGKILFPRGDNNEILNKFLELSLVSRTPSQISTTQKKILVNLKFVKKRDNAFFKKKSFNFQKSYVPDLPSDRGI